MLLPVPRQCAICIQPELHQLEELSRSPAADRWQFLWLHQHISEVATPPDQLLILEQLCARELIFHASLADNPDRLMASDYWEVTASGKIYTGTMILEHLATTNLLTPKPRVG
jgi:hypothetical protein